MLGETNGSEQSSHHQMSSTDDDLSVSMAPCAHQDCDGCDQLQDTCATLDYAVLSMERDSRVLSLVDIDSDLHDLSFINLALDNPWPRLAPQLTPPFYRYAASLPSETPVRRNDQLTE
jgi:hypothetical protein